MAARELRNVSGVTLTVQDVEGRVVTVEPDGILTVDGRDERYYQTGETGELTLWAEVTKATKASTKGDK